MEDPDVPEVLQQASQHGAVRSRRARYFLGRETIIVTRRRGMAIWREQLFVVMARNAGSDGVLPLPTEQVVELGVQVEM